MSLWSDRATTPTPNGNLPFARGGGLEVYPGAGRTGVGVGDPNWWRNAIRNDKFTQLSPQSQQLMQEYAQRAQQGERVNVSTSADPRLQQLKQEFGTLNYFQGLPDWVGKAAVIAGLATFGGAVAAGYLGGGGAAAGTTGAATGPVAGPVTSAGMAAAMPGSMATVTPAGVGLGGAGLAGAAAPALVGSSLPKALLLSGLIGTGAQTVEGILNRRAAGKAADQQRAAIDQAIALQTPLYNQALTIAQEHEAQGRADLAPYAGAGAQGLTSLTSLLGLPSAPAPRAPVSAPTAPPTAPTGAPGGMVLLRAPTGQTQAVPADQAAFYVARGATRV